MLIMTLNVNDLNIIIKGKRLSFWIKHQGQSYAISELSTIKYSWSKRVEEIVLDKYESQGTVSDFISKGQNKLQHRNIFREKEE